MSSKKTKRRKLIWYSDEERASKQHLWDTNPLVIMAREIQKQSWFKGDIQLGIGNQIRHPNTQKSNPIDQAKIVFEKNGVLNTQLQLTEIYKNVKIQVLVTWLFKEYRCGIHLYKPSTQTYYPRGLYCTGKKTKSKYVDGVLKRIKDAFDEGYQKSEAISIQEQQQAAKKAERVKFHEDLSDALGVELKTMPFRKNKFEYGQNRAYGLSFSLLNEQEDFFGITSIKGKFSREEIKQFIKIIGGNPRAIRNRLIQ